MGKLSDADWRTIDRSLRAEAIELLRRIDALPDAGPAPVAPGAGGPLAPRT
jgi:hypothetical protein